MQALTENICVLLIFAFAGWFLGKRHILSSQNLKLLAVLEVWVFLPCNCLRSFSRNFTVAYIREKYPMILISTCIVVALVALNAWLVPRFVKGKYQQKIIQYALTLPNHGYIGYPLIQSVYGEVMLLNAQVFAIPMLIYSNSEGYRLLTNSDSVSLKKLINPSLIAMLIGAVVGLNGWHLPNILETVANNGANCMGPISMILAGITISDYDMKELLRNKRSYVIVFFRLILIPLALCFALNPFVNKEILMIVVLLYSMPCGLNTIVFPKMVGEDCRPGASMAMLSTLACLFTIPFCMQVLAWVQQMH